LKERDQSEELGVDGRIISDWIFGKESGKLDWIHLAQDNDKWRAIVNAVMNFWIP
jgi:hypothetical protein